MQGMRSYFPNGQITDDVAAEYADDWIVLVRSYGIERFEEACALARRYRLLDNGETAARVFPPLPGEIEDFIKRRTEPLYRSQTDLQCQACKGTGWKYEKPDDPARTVVRCHCRKLVRR